MAIINRRLGSQPILLLLAFLLTACTGEKVKAPGNLPIEVIIAQTLMQFLNEKKVEEASAFFEEGAT